jgi:putative transposase
VSRPKRLPKRSYVGHAEYFLTFCVLNRSPVFRDAAVVAEALGQVQRTAKDESFEVLAYCFMPDHVHLLVKGIDKGSDLRRFAKMSKQRSGYVYRTRSGQQLWQEGYFERVLRDDADARSYARYIVTDPLRAGLVATPAEYAYLGTTQWTLEELTGAAINERGASNDMTPGPKDPAYTVAERGV